MSQPETDEQAPPPSTRLAQVALPALVVLLGSTLLLPKLVLTSFATDRMFVRYGVWHTLLALQQDLLLATLAVVALLAVGRRATRLRWVGAGLALGCVLLLLLFDLRVRELWLKPVDLSMLSYGLSNFDDLTSGASLFFKHNAGWGMTFRRMLVVFGSLYCVLWGLSYAALFRWRLPSAVEGDAGSRLRGRYVGGGVLGLLFVTSVCVGQHRYRIDDNIVVRPAVNLVRGMWDSSEAEVELAAEHDQPARPLTEVLGDGSRRILNDVKPFRNAILLVFESARLKSVDLEGQGPTLTPTLRLLAREGLHAKCYVCLPHSSKAYYSVLTGRHPFPGIEMKESLIEHHESLMRLVQDQLGADVSVYTSAYLAFENTDGLLAACGVERRVESPSSDGSGTSFGKNDTLLYGMVPDELAKRPRPFVSYVINLAAHYPYDYPGKQPGDGEGLEAYERALAYSDTQLAEFIGGLSAQGLLDDTVFVIVGDHGESFGEHGSVGHNNSLYEEEATVPLIFWSADGRLQHDELLVAQQIDIAPTVADLLGITAGELPVQGRSLLRAEGDAPIYMTTFFEGVGQALIEGHTKYLYQADSGILLKFDLAADPGEARPAEVEGEEREAVVRRLQAFRAYQRQAFAE